jgi:IS30 family transposase
MHIKIHSYLALPLEAEQTNALAVVRARERVRRKKRLLKLTPQTLRIAAWLTDGHSYQRICDLISYHSEIKVSRSTLCRFIKANPLLTKSLSSNAKLPIFKPLSSGNLGCQGDKK